MSTPAHASSVRARRDAALERAAEAAAAAGAARDSGRRRDAEMHERESELHRAAAVLHERAIQLQRERLHAGSRARQADLLAGFEEAVREQRELAILWAERARTMSEHARVRAASIRRRAGAG